MVIIKLCDPTSRIDDTNNPKEMFGVVLVLVEEDVTKLADSTSVMDDDNTVVISLALSNVRDEEATA